MYEYRVWVASGRATLVSLETQLRSIDEFGYEVISVTLQLEPIQRFVIVSRRLDEQATRLPQPSDITIERPNYDEST